jgi:hypothetical protein
VFGLPPGLRFSSKFDAIIGTPTATGSYPVEILASDSSRPHKHLGAIVSALTVAKPK